MGEVKSAVSKSLQQTVAEHKHIDQVHFDAAGNHYFNVHEYVPTVGKDKDGNKVKDKNEGGLYGRIASTEVIIGSQKVEYKTPILNTKIVESVDRDSILNVIPQSDVLNLSTSALSAEEQAVIEKMRAKTAKTAKTE